MRCHWCVLALLFCLVIFCADLAFGYVVVLKNGKTIEGTIVSEDSSQIRIKDRDGVEVTIRTNQMDLQATSQANTYAEPVIVPADNEEAREVKSKRTGKSKVWKNEDLKDLPEITVMGVETTSPDDDSFRQSMEEQEKVAQSWKDAAMEIYQRMLQARQRYDSLRKQCEELSLSAGFATEYLLQRGGSIGSPVIGQAAEVCARMEQAADDLALVEQEMFLLEEDARQKGIPPGWVDPLRY